MTKSEIYEDIEPLLNSDWIVLLDNANLESQLLGLIWRGGKIDHPNGEHDDWANAAAGGGSTVLLFPLVRPRKMYKSRPDLTVVG